MQQENVLWTTAQYFAWGSSAPTNFELPRGKLYFLRLSFYLRRINIFPCSFSILMFLLSFDFVCDVSPKKALEKLK